MMMVQGEFGSSEWQQMGWCNGVSVCVPKLNVKSWPLLASESGARSPSDDPMDSRQQISSAKFLACDAWALSIPSLITTIHSRWLALRFCNCPLLSDKSMTIKTHTKHYTTRESQARIKWRRESKHQPLSKRRKARRRYKMDLVIWFQLSFCTGSSSQSRSAS